MRAWNVKRLRPIELGPFDYESEPRTTSGHHQFEEPRPAFRG
ncbi:MAG: hypothetical protein ABIR28_02845 [Vicinamibacteria bacterium]